jgi:integrase
MPHFECEKWSRHSKTDAEACVNATAGDELAKARLLTQAFIENVKATNRREEYPDTKAPGLRLVVQATAHKSFALRYYLAGRRRKYTLDANGLADARKEAVAALAEISKGIDPATQKAAVKAARAVKPDDSRRIEKVVDEFVERYARRRTGDWKETRRRLVKDVALRWQGRRIEVISKADIIRMLDDIVDRGASRGVNRIYASVRKFFNWCVERNIIETSPCAGLRKPAPDSSRDRVLSDAELALLWHAAGGLQFPYQQIIRLLALTGARRDEIASMRWSEIDFELRIFNLPKQRSKNGRAHSLPLSDSAVDILKGIPRFAGSGLLFSLTGKGPPTGWSVVKKKLDGAIAEINGGERIPDFVIHDVRRSVASGMAALGIELHVIERVLNHVSGSFGGIVSVYQKHKFEDQMRDALDRWARHVERVVGGEAEGRVVELPKKAVTK